MVLLLDSILENVSDPEISTFVTDAKSTSNFLFYLYLAYAFTGIPFAKPPVGDLRFKPSVPPTPWTTPFAANYVPNGCIQACELPTGGCPITQSEDCLYLNVYVPTNVLNTQNNVPVLVFIHGGNYRQVSRAKIFYINNLILLLFIFNQGYSNCPLYDGQYIANQTGNIVVTLNYRLGAFGFFVNANVDGNAGITDQR